MHWWRFLTFRMTSIKTAFSGYNYVLNDNGNTMYTEHCTQSQCHLLYHIWTNETKNQKKIANYPSVAYLSNSVCPTIRHTDECCCWVRLAYSLRQCVKQRRCDKDEQLKQKRWNKNRRYYWTSRPLLVDYCAHYRIRFCYDFNRRRSNLNR